MHRWTSCENLPITVWYKNFCPKMYFSGARMIWDFDKSEMKGSQRLLAGLLFPGLCTCGLQALLSKKTLSDYSSYHYQADISSNILKSKTQHPATSKVSSMCTRVCKNAWKLKFLNLFAFWYSFSSTWHPLIESKSWLDFLGKEYFVLTRWMEIE